MYSPAERQHTLRFNDEQMNGLLWCIQHYTAPENNRRWVYNFRCQLQKVLHERSALDSSSRPAEEAFSYSVAELLIISKIASTARHMDVCYFWVHMVQGDIDVCLQQGA